MLTPPQGSSNSHSRDYSPRTLSKDLSGGSLKQGTSRTASPLDLSYHPQRVQSRSKDSKSSKHVQQKVGDVPRVTSLDIVARLFRPSRRNRDCSVNVRNSFGDSPGFSNMLYSGCHLESCAKGR